MVHPLICYVVNSFLCLLYKKEFVDYMKIKDVGSLQRERLITILRNNTSCEYGEKYDFANIDSIASFQSKVPLTDYEDYKPYIEKIKQGKKNILTVEDVLLLELSSGSTSPSKLIPYTRALKEEFQKGIRPWLYNLYASYKGIKWGQSYWSVTPATINKQYTEGGLPIGFEDDKEYFGAVEKKLLDVIFAVPSEVARSDNMEAFYYKTALGLLKSRDLTLISIWNPSYLTLLLEYMENNVLQLTTEIAVKNKKRSEEVRRCLTEKNLSMLWPNLKVISCWCDGHAKTHADQLQALFPQVAIQPKGLLATEGFVSFPLAEAGGAVLSVKSHFFEFEAVEDSRIYLADQLEKGKDYAVILTTSGGFYRYKLKDLIQVTGFLGEIPIVRFLGKQDKVSDLFGEKINELFIIDTMEQMGVERGFFMLAPETDRYVLYVKSKVVAKGFAQCLDDALRENFHYDYCRKLGQLKPLKVFISTGNMEEEYLAECVRRGQRLGDIKPVALHLQGGWDEVFKGEYL